MKPILIFALSLFSFNAISQAELAGIWKGKIAAFELTIVFHINEKDGKLSASMDSPDQGANGIPCDQVTVTGKNIVISVTSIGGNYTGTISSDGKTIKGKWNQGGGSFDLDLGRNGIPATKPKAQTPQPPFDYEVEEVEYDSENRTVHLVGTLTRPKGEGRFPAAILVSGSGQQDRDESIMGHKPFAVIADRLTKLGFAVLRVDDRGTGKSKGEVRSATSADFARDVARGIEYLKSRKEIDTNRIGLVGHSEGGLIAALLAERKDIHYMVLLAGPGIPGSALLAEQGEQLLLQSGVSPEAVKNYLPFYRRMIDLSAAGGDSANLAANIRSEYHAWKAKSNHDLVKQVGFSDIANAEAVLQNLINSFTARWMQYFLASDAAALLENTRAKVLALNGEKDVQVLPTSNTEGLRKALSKSKSTSYEVKVLPGLNHLFQTCRQCTVMEYGMLEETFSETALTEMTNWLQKNVLR